ncbi:glycosyltransferase family 9 protein [Larkinella soli]|uniref:glycosyltransferase family 9 protein n=1 Tax=Larkinella soli TaxID=1770527 RepID=UPI000FFB5D3C|nr:glycosyltransferase family 9 protein [Larkinella soli]
MKTATTRNGAARGAETAPWHFCRNILCVRPDNLGDVLMTTPAFRALKEAVPGRRLTLLTSSAGAGIACAVPEIDAVITFDLPWVQTPEGSGPDRVMELVQQLRGRQFDGAVIFNVQSQNPLPSALVCYLAGIPRVLGYCRENPYQLMTDWVPDPEVLVATRHEVDRQLDLVAAVGSRTADRRLSLTVSETARRQAGEALRNAGVRTNEPWVVLHAGVSEAKRQYGAANFSRVARRLTEEKGCQVVLTGSAAEQENAEAIRQAVGKNVYNLAGAFSLDVFVALIAQAPVVLSNNTGPVHIAAAVGTPVVVAYARTNPQHTPWMVPNRVLYFDVPDPLRSRNVLLQQFPDAAGPEATPDAVVQAVEELLSEKIRDICIH